MADSKTLALVINAGSSSLKYGLFELRSGAVDELCSGLCDKIGMEGSLIKHTVDGKSDKKEMALPDHVFAMKKVTEMLTGAGGMVKDISAIKVVGHRVVHGGDKFSTPAVVDAATEAEIEKCTTLAPLHNPANLSGIRAARGSFPSAQQVAVFDTAFHATMPPESFRYAIPKELYEKHHIRRYGFHGTSYKYVSAAAAEFLDRPLEDLNMIIFHLGNGASMACLQNGKVVDTTMGLTPLEGLVMGTRSGDLDPGAYTHLCNELKMTPKEVDTLLNKKSGLLGISGNADMRENIDRAAKGDQDALLARALTVQRLRKYVGSFLVRLNGDLDALVFTAGVGENDRGLREMVCAGLESLGVDIDVAENQKIQGKLAEVQSSKSRAKILVVPTNEELSIATQSLELCKFMSSSAAKPTESKSTILKIKDVVSPKEFTYNMFSIARSNKQHIVLPEGSDPRIIKAAGEIIARGLANLTILGNPAEVAKIAKQEGVSLEGVPVIDNATVNIDDMVASLVAARKASGMTPEQAKELVRDSTWFGTMMMHMGKIDGMVSGAIHSTGDTMRPALQVIKAAPGVSLVSSTFFMLLNGGVKFYSDCGLVPNPTTDEMADITMQTADTARSFGLNPRIAMLSYATGSADKGDMIDKVREATAKAKKLRPSEMIEGPIQYDAAVDPFVADVKFKGKPGDVAGRASVLIMPNLDVGNIAYKVAQQSSGCVAIGPIMQGLNKPVNDLSRGCTVQDVVHCVVVTALQSMAAKSKAPASKL